jgi:acyl-CoA synthetase (AMP-forming)/AMP-acid ligase II
VLPLTILNIYRARTGAAWQYGVVSVAMDRIDAVGVAEWVERERICTFAAVPTVIHDLLTQPDVKPEQLVSLVQPLIGGAECPEEFRALYRERFGADVAIGYGMTEAPTRGDARRGRAAAACRDCAGRRCRSARSRSAATDGRELPAGKRRARSVSGPRARGRGRASTRRCSATGIGPDCHRGALAGGVYHTGDIGVLEPTARCSSAGAATS